MYFSYFVCRRTVISILLFIALVPDTFSLFTTQVIDARSAGIGGSGILNTNIWANFSNQGGLGHVEKTTAAIHYEDRFMLREISTKALAFAIPAKGSTFGINYTYMGYSKYNESKAGIAYGKKFGNHISTGIQLNYHYVYIAENYGNRGKVSVEGGFIAEPLENLMIGFHLFNPSHIKIKSDYNEYIPSFIRAAVGYTFYENTYVSVQTGKEIDREEIFRFGIEHMAYDFLFLRIGAATTSSQYTFGLGIITGSLQTDIAFMSHRELGYSPHISIAYVF